MERKQKGFRNIVVNAVEYEWIFTSTYYIQRNGSIYIRKKGNNGFNLTLDTGWYDFWFYGWGTTNDSCEIWQVTPEFIKNTILFALENGWVTQKKHLEIKYIDQQYCIIPTESKSNSLRKPDLEVEINFLFPLKERIHNRSSIQFFYNIRNWKARIFTKNEFIENKTEKVCIQMAHPEFHKYKFFTGKTFSIENGRTHIGNGTVTRVLTPDFEIPNLFSELTIAIQDFEKLAPILINKLITETQQPEKENIDKGNYSLIQNTETRKLSDHWKYDVRGRICFFRNTQTQQIVGIVLDTKEDILNLDINFFIHFITTNEKYKKTGRNFFCFHDMNNVFINMEKEGILTHISGAEYKRINY